MLVVCLIDASNDDSDIDPDYNPYQESLILFTNTNTTSDSSGSDADIVWGIRKGVLLLTGRFLLILMFLVIITPLRMIRKIFQNLILR